MTKRLPADPAPGPLLPVHSKIMPPTSTAFSPLTLAQRRAFRRYLQGHLLLSAERNKTLTALANTEPVVGGAQRKEAQGLQWFLSKVSFPNRVGIRKS